MNTTLNYHNNYGRGNKTYAHVQHQVQTAEAIHVHVCIPAITPSLCLADETTFSLLPDSFEILIFHSPLPRYSSLALPSPPFLVPFP